MNLPESVTEAYEVVKSFELVIQTADGSKRCRVDVLLELKHVTSGPPYCVRYYEHDHGGPWVQLKDMPWVHESSSERAAEQAIHWLHSRLA